MLSFLQKFLMLLLCCVLTACTPKVGSKKWCENLTAKPKGEWMISEAKDYVTYCIFPKGEGN